MDGRTYATRDQSNPRVDEYALHDFLHDYLVCCPRCGKSATVLADGWAYSETVRLSCEHCGLSKEKNMGSICSTGRNAFIVGRDVDPAFHLPLRLRMECAGHVLWASNWEHLAYLERLVAAKLRRGRSDRMFGSPLAHKLPRWMLTRKHRDEVLRAIARIRRSPV